jgi:hypothetical protein
MNIHDFDSFTEKLNAAKCKKKNYFLWTEILDFFFKKSSAMFEKIDLGKKDWWMQIDS